MTTKAERELKEIKDRINLARDAILKAREKNKTHPLLADGSIGLLEYIYLGDIEKIKDPKIKKAILIYNQEESD